MWINGDLWEISNWVLVWNQVWILCNDCGVNSHVQFHIVAHKCLSCNSYNTKQIQGTPNSCSSRVAEMVRWVFGYSHKKDLSILKSQPWFSSGMETALIEHTWPVSQVSFSTNSLVIYSGKGGIKLAQESSQAPNFVKRIVFLLCNVIL